MNSIVYETAARTDAKGHERNKVAAALIETMTRQPCLIKRTDTMKIDLWDGLGVLPQTLYDPIAAQIEGETYPLDSIELDGTICVTGAPEGWTLLRITGTWGWGTYKQRTTLAADIAGNTIDVGDYELRLGDIVQIDNELLTVEAWSADDGYTVERGILGTEPMEHSSGSKVMVLELPSDLVEASRKIDAINSAVISSPISTPAREEQVDNQPKVRRLLARYTRPR